MSMIDEYIKRTRMADSFDQRTMRDRIRCHCSFIKGIENFPNRVRCHGSLSTLSDLELIAYDEYLNCTINAYLFGEYLQEYVRFSDAEQ